MGRVGGPPGRAGLGGCLNRPRAGRVLCIGVALAAAGMAAAQSAPAAPSPHAQPAPQAAPAAAAAPGIVELTAHRSSGVVSAWLANGIRLHHLRLSGPLSSMDTSAEPRVLIMASLAGGEIEETEATLGLTGAAAWTWVSEISDGPEARSLREHRIRLQASSVEDAILIRIEAPASELDAAVRLLGRMLTESRISQRTLDRWAKWYAKRNRDHEGEPGWAVARALSGATRPPGEVRFRPIPTAAAQAVRVDDVRAWLGRMLGVGGPGARANPLEIAVTGDVALADVLRAAERTLAALPARDRIGPATFATLRARGEAPAGPLAVRTLLPVKGERACAGAGFRGLDEFTLRDHRLLWIAALALDERMTTEVRERGWAGITDVITVAQPGGVTPGEAGLVITTVAVRPDRAEAAADLAAAITDDLAARGPTPDEFRRARDEMAADMRRLLSSPSYWANQLSRMDYRGAYLPDDVAAGPEMIASFTQEDVAAALCRYATPMRRVRLIVDPEPEIVAPIGDVRP